MTFIDTNDPERQPPYVLNTFLGLQDGATRLFLLRGIKKKPYAKKKYHKRLLIKDTNCRSK